MESELKQKITQLHKQAQRTNHRYLIVLQGELTWAQMFLPMTLDRSLWLSEQRPNCIDNKYWQWTCPEQATLCLGLEFNLLVVQVQAQLSVNAFVALTGTVKGGGLVFLLVPHQLIRNNFIDYLYSHLDHASVFFCKQGDNLGHNDHELLDQESPLPLRLNSDNIYYSSQQAQAVILIKKVFTGHRLRPLLLSADRGRGKSAALGIAIAQLLLDAPSNRSLNFIVTAPAFINASVIFSHIINVLQCKLKGYALLWKGHRVQFVAPELLLQWDLTKQKAIDFLLVDEAAAIPIHQLITLVNMKTRVCFATTIHGYEGTGQGILQKFCDYLTLYQPEWRRFTMDQPIRWSENDPLEAWLYDTFLLDVDSVHEQTLSDYMLKYGNDDQGNKDQFKPLIQKNNKVDVAITERLQILLITQQQLLEDKALLRQVFALLMQAHYRTTPSDLVQLLNNKHQLLWIAIVAQQIIGCCLAVVEPKMIDSIDDLSMIDESHSFDKKVGNRSLLLQFEQHRFRDRLLMQTIIRSFAQYQCLNSNAIRIQRIAVMNNYRRLKIGLTLMTAVINYAMRHEICYLGVSYALDETALKFWSYIGFMPVKISSKRDKSAGRYPLLMLKSIDSNQQQKNQQWIDTLVTYFFNNLLLLLLESLSQLEPELFVLLWQKQLVLPQCDERERKNESESESESEMELINKKVMLFVQESLPYDDVLIELKTWFLHQLRYLSDQQLVLMQQSCGFILVDKLVKHKTWSELCNCYHISGKKQAVDQVRATVKQLLTYRA